MICPCLSFAVHCARAVSEFKANQVQPVIDKIQAAAASAQDAYPQLNDAVCAAK